jgi:hypothetical protein
MPSIEIGSRATKPGAENAMAPGVRSSAEKLRSGSVAGSAVRAI